MQTKRVVIDTNLWISYLISDKYKFLDELIISGSIKLVFSKELLNEFVDVAIRPKFNKYFNKEDVNSLISMFYNYGMFFEIISNVKICRDSKDNFLLNLAIDSQADYLVTGDTDLLVISEFHSTKIIKISQLKNLYQYK
ncbi:MAG: putative toxin-antitoxin system toxin component, PIN family [Candidatus Kapabacteria bacterium]|nr:putative toxin-antitoxin system toxin component, PIN family [Candidatus Kapabacteria bacterium]